MHALSETVVIGLLVMIAFGWSLNYLSGPYLEIAKPGCNFYCNLVGFVALMNIMMTLLTQLGNNNHDRHHIFDTASGTLLII